MVTARKPRGPGRRGGETGVRCRRSCLLRAGPAAAMMIHGFQSSHRDFSFGPWKLTATKTHIMKSADVEKTEGEHSKEVIKPYDWTFTTDYKGTLLGEALKLKVVPTTDHIDTEKLKAREQIKFFEEVLLFEDELHDHGVSSLSVKIRVMPSSFFLLLRFFLRIDGVLIRMNDTRLYHEADKTYMLREYTSRESRIANLMHVPPSLFTEPNEMSQYLPIKETVCEKLIFPERIDQNPSDSQANAPVE
ncbi:TIP41-like protein isoform X3 [Eptesicus fuscus]|uniref:TIP41-like protein isoform X3 n=1 Tax=Eptesicus fuscus TaxID=29078 RepID=UPI0024042D5D|nr:TIP41-like protein isoform X3 [Eptesicus fuscus]